MTADSLILLAREYLGDKVQPYLWSDSFLLGALNRAEQEAAVRTLCFNDETTDAVTKISVLANTATYTLDSRVIRIDSLLYDGKPLPQVDPDDIKDTEWRDQTGTPTYWFCDGRKVTFVPKPITTATVRLKAKRLPLVDMTLAANPNASPEIEPYLQRHLLHWVCWEAHQIIDSDVARPDWAMNQLAQFERVFGPQVSARVQIHQRRSPRTLTHAPAPYVSSRTTSDEDW